VSTTAGPNQNRPFLDWYLIPEAYSAPLVEQALARFAVPPGAVVLDPFAGSGTTPVTAALQGRAGLAVEVNPFLAFATRVKSTFTYDLAALRRDLEEVRRRAERAAANPNGALGEGPAMPRLTRWISPLVVRRVLAVRAEVEAVAHPAHRDLCRLALAAVLRPASNMRLSPHAFGSRVPREDAPVGEWFVQRLEKMERDIREHAGRPDLGRVTLLNRDARALAEVVHNFPPVDFAMTSPPYLNNLDYTMQTRLELFFLGFVRSMSELRALRRAMVVSDAKAMYRDVPDSARVRDVPGVQAVARALAERFRGRGWGWDYAFMATQYFGGMLRMLEGVFCWLRPGAHFVLVLGSSAHGGVLVPVPELVADLAERAGYRVEGIEVLRVRRSSSHGHRLAESALVLRRPL